MTFLFIVGTSFLCLCATFLRLELLPFTNLGRTFLAEIVETGKEEIF